MLSALLVVCATIGCEAGVPGGPGRPTSPSPPSSAASEVPAAAATALAPQLETVARVVDGDTLLLVGGERVRVLGIDACEASTPQGPAATAAARGFLGAGAVVLDVEPGVERDR